ncbi:anti-sigma factor family protein [Streptomyces scabiei]|uniref:anti-sigma factor family protein n=1 Tax=Streptomyces scabiei TaxID=1930 RepID=UPI0035ABE0F9
MSGSRPTSAEQHLGDRLSALVDGELGHEARDRVLAHLATCGKCKTEADEQRRLKNVFAEAAPPPPRRAFWPGSRCSRRAATATVRRCPVASEEDSGARPAAPDCPAPQTPVTSPTSASSEPAATPSDTSRRDRTAAR